MHQSVTSSIIQARSVQLDKHSTATDWVVYLAVDGHTVDAVVVTVEGLGTKPTASIPHGDGLVRGSSAEAAAEGLPANLIHRIHMAPGAGPYHLKVVRVFRGFLQHL